MSPSTLTVNTTDIEHDSKYFTVKKVIFHLFETLVNDKFHHTIQFHPAMSLQKVALPSPFFYFFVIAVFTLSWHLAGEMSGKFKNALEKSKSGFQRMPISQCVFNLDTWNLIHMSKTCWWSEMSRSFRPLLPKLGLISHFPNHNTPKFEGVAKRDHFGKKLIMGSKIDNLFL